MNFYGVNQGFYEIEMGFYDIEVGVYEIDGRVYEMVPSEEQMLLLRHRRLTADVEPVRGSLRRALVVRGLVRSTGKRRWVVLRACSGELRVAIWCPGAPAYGVQESW